MSMSPVSRPPTIAYSAGNMTSLSTLPDVAPKIAADP
jgi:hypothetical protein